MSLVQLRQKEFSFRREETVRTSVRERRNEGTKERKKQGREKGAEEADDPEVVRPAERDSSKTRSYYEHIKKPQGAICWLSFQTFFQPVYIGNNVNLRGAFFILSVSCPFSCLFLSRPSSPRFFSTSPFLFPFLFSAAHTISLLASAVCEPINQCEIFALARLTEGPPCHLWALKRVANIANKK